jgi:transposase-like protein
MERRRKFKASFKAEVAIEAIKEKSTLSELSLKYHVEVAQISKWKREFIEHSSLVFSKDRPDKAAVKEKKALYEQVGKLIMQVEFLKKNL